MWCSMQCNQECQTKMMSVFHESLSSSPSQVSSLCDPSQVWRQLFMSPSQVASNFFYDLSANRVQVADSSFHL